MKVNKGNTIAVLQPHLQTLIAIHKPLLQNATPYIPLCKLQKTNT